MLGIVFARRVSGHHPPRARSRHPRAREHPRVLDDRIPDELTVRRAGQTIAVITLTIAIGAGMLMRVVDHNEFPTFGSGLWWSVQTVTTVGYGDHVPSNLGGKLVAVFVMISGLGFLSVVT